MNYLSSQNKYTNLIRILTITICGLGLFLAKPNITFAHEEGQSSFFLINNKYADLYPIYTTSLPNFKLPQDLAPENYLVSKPINFEIDSDALPFSKQVTDQTTFHWDFGDGEITEGLVNSHIYKKIGTYLLIITADYHGSYKPDTKQPLQAILINIVPNKDYQLPKAVIKVNKRIINDPDQPLEIAKGDVELDATSSKPGSAKITNYFWDLGDGKDSAQSVLKYSYEDLNKTYIFPMLRVKDANGFISDTYAQLEILPESQTTKATKYPITLIIILNIIIISSLIYLFRKRS